jgi:hypothetical protein
MQKYLSTSLSSSFNAHTCPNAALRSPTNSSTLAASSVGWIVWTLLSRDWTNDLSLQPQSIRSGSIVPTKAFRLVATKLRRSATKLLHNTHRFSHASFHHCIPAGLKRLPNESPPGIAQQRIEDQPVIYTNPPTQQPSPRTKPKTKPETSFTQPKKCGTKRNKLRQPRKSAVNGIRAAKSLSRRVDSRTVKHQRIKEGKTNCALALLKSTRR